MAAQGKEDEEGDAAIWGRPMEARSITATVLSRKAYMAGLARRCGPTVPLGAEAEEAVQLSRFLLLGPIWPNWTEQHATFEFERVHSGPEGLSTVSLTRKVMAGCWVHCGQLVWP